MSPRFTRPLTGLGLLIALLIAGPLPSASATPPGIPSASVATAELATLTVAAWTNSDTYDRSLFPTWDTISGTCNTRETVLKRDGTNVVVNSACAATSGSWYSPYDGATWTAASDVDIDHVVPLKNAWESGAWAWTTAKRESYANDLTDPQLIAVTDNVNQSKSDQSPDAWKPPLTSYYCTYAEMWVRVKYVWALTITSAEKSALASMLGTCSGSTGNTVTVTGPGSQSSTVGTAVSLQISATDSASATLTYTASGLPTGLSIGSSTGLISGTPTTAGTYSTSVTATDSTGASGSASFTWTVSTAGSGTCTSAQLLGNNGFESGSTTWTASSGVITNSSSEAARTGSYYAWLDGYAATHTDTLSQSVTIPSGCNATLTFYLHIDTDETASTAYDTLTVAAGSTTLATVSNVNAASGYVLKTYSLSSFAGSTVTIKFTGVEDSSLQTSFVIDDTAVTTS